MNIQDPDWGDFEVARPVPINENPWGDFALLEGTHMGNLINVVPGPAFANATRGHATPLMNAIGRPPKRCLQMLGSGYQRCRVKECAMRTDRCVPGPRTPLCFVPDTHTSESPDIGGLEATIIRLWVEGVYVIVVGPDEF